MQSSFTPLLNPFAAKHGTGQAIASDLTWRTLAAAYAVTQEHGVEVACTAAILPCDEAAVRFPCTSTVQLARTVLDIAELSPPRQLPLIADLPSAVPSQADDSTHIVFGNMDIAVQPRFYLALQELVERLGHDVHFTVARTNIDAALAQEPYGTAISRMTSRNKIVPGSAFDRLDRRHFQRNARRSSTMLRKMRRIPMLSSLILRVKRAIGRQH